MHMGTKPFFGAKKWFAATGWRQSAKVNCAALLVSSVALAVLVIVVLARGSLKPVFFYAAECESGKVAAGNLALHLLINIASTLVILNAPTRQEIDSAHLKSSWLGIGVPSVRNAFRVSSFKTWCWVSFLLSSIPIHLLFNSTVFEVDRRESDYHLSIATEQFLHGGEFYPPGSSLAIPGLVSIDDSYIPDDSFVYRPPGDTYEYGYPVNKTDYKDRSTPVVSNVSSIAKKAAEWERLEIAECKAEYVACRGLKTRGSVVLVVDNPDGWAWSDMWQLNETETEFWDQYIPSGKPNHLFFDAQCGMIETTNNGVEKTCQNNCAAALGSILERNSVNTVRWEYPFFTETALAVVNASKPESEPDFGPTSWLYHTMTSGLQKDSFNVSVSYCLAEPLENICRIGISPTLLLSVLLCVIAKTITAIVVTIVLNRPEHIPLVTLGDAMASFIEHPDAVTAGLCTLDQKQIRTAMGLKHAQLAPGPRRWIKPRQTWASVIPVSVWSSSYALFASGIITCAVLLHEGLSTIHNSASSFGSFLANDTNPFIPLSFSLIQGVLLANSPQLLLSFCYLAYNNLFTRLQMAKEWSRFGEGYNSLRVTDPRGQQYSTYRLQLPYKYSIPLIVASISLHWLVSNTIYVFVSTGGYFGNSGDLSLPANTAIAVGYSPPSLVALIIVSSLLIAIPPILALKKLPASITQPGSNSLAISAACHSSTVSRVSKGSSTAGNSSSTFENTPSSYTPVKARSSTDLDIEMSSQRGLQRNGPWKPGSHNILISWFSGKRIVGKENGPENDDEDDDVRSPLKRLAQGRLRWGVIQMPTEWHDEYGHDDPVRHLGFGAEEDGPKDPIPGRMYA